MKTLRIIIGAILVSCTTTKPLPAKKLPKSFCIDGILFEPYEDLNKQARLVWVPNAQGKPVKCED